MYVPQGILYGADRIFMTAGSKLKDVKSLEQAFPYVGYSKSFRPLPVCYDVD